MAEPAFLLDSNICIYILDDAESPAARHVGRCAVGSVVTSAIVYAEVVRGLGENPKLVDKANALFELVPILPFDGAVARTYASLPFRRGTFDRLIAAHALTLGLTLVTNNEADFADVPALRVENWARS